MFRCDVGDCDQKFVRLDLLSRHKKRHTATYTPRNRIPSFDTVGDRSTAQADYQSNTPSRQSFSHPSIHHHNGSHSGPHNSAVILTPDSATAATPLSQSLHHHRTNSWAAPVDDRNMHSSMLRQHRNSFYASDMTMPDAPTLNAFADVGYANDDPMAPENFAAWLFNPQTTYNDLNVTSLPFLEAGLESTFNSNIHYDYESMHSLSPIDPTPPRSLDVPDEWMTESRRQEILQWFHIFRKKQPRYDEVMPNLVRESHGDLPALSVDMMRECLREFWDHVSPRLPIVHQHTFSPNRCPIFLLCVMLALGAASLRSRDATGQLVEYRAFADVIISCVRWDILTSDDSMPPAQLWVAQALLLLEFYEKLYSTRRFHERAHIYHPAFLTLLRRGSPLIGRNGTDSPAEPDGGGLGEPQRSTSGIPLDSRTWWVRWAETESMHRVVFAAFMLDIIHAAIFGHAADMAAHEIRLPLPCDDNLWAASSPDVVRQLDANFRMYGVKQVSFLDGLKSALHGKEVKTHSFGRMIIISGLLSVGWQLSHRETHLKWLDLRTPSTELQDNWRKMLLRAFDNWKGSFDVAMADHASSESGLRAVPNGPINSASLLFHLAHMTPNVDIIDCQVYAGAKRLLGRKVSARDYANATKRMVAWSKLSSTRHAIFHAFKLLHKILVEPQPRRRTPGTTSSSTTTSRAGHMPSPGTPGQTMRYSIYNEPDPHRPWIMYFAVLTIWAFVQAYGQPATKPLPLHSPQMGASAYGRTADYLSKVASLPELDERSASMLQDGLGDLLDVMVTILQDATTELLAEARDKLTVCREMLNSSR